jgi:hypothetical protein
MCVHVNDVCRAQMNIIYNSDFWFLARVGMICWQSQWSDAQWQCSVFPTLPQMCGGLEILNNSKVCLLGHKLSNGFLFCHWHDWS